MWVRGAALFILKVQWNLVKASPYLRGCPQKTTWVKGIILEALRQEKCLGTIQVPKYSDD